MTSNEFNSTTYEINISFFVCGKMLKLFRRPAFNCGYHTPIHKNSEQKEWLDIRNEDNK